MKYLALGDSYTIGEMLPEKDNFPHQFAAILQQEQFGTIQQVQVIAKTGWTSEELFLHLSTLNDLPHDNDIVTLLIGVNDQYRGLALEQYEPYFLKLLMRAILFAGGQSRRVYVLSIPDWGVTPFAENEGKDIHKIASEIDVFNKRNKVLTLAYRCHYLDITALSRHQGLQPDFLTEDKLHYSAKAYHQWAERLAKLVKDTLPG